MRDYAKFAPTFWTRGSGKAIRGKKDAQLLAAYLMTSPHANMIGLYYIPLVTLCHEVGLSEREARAAFAILGAEGVDIAHYDEDAELVWLPAMASYQIGPELKPGDKRRGGPIVAEASKIGSHRFTFAFWDRYGVAYGLGECPFQAPFDNAGSPLRAPTEGHQAQSGRAGAGEEQEQEQEQERARKRASRLPPEWNPSTETVEALRRDLRVEPLAALPSFRDYWLSASGARATKHDWDATFRNWVRRDADRLPTYEPPNPKPAPVERAPAPPEALAAIAELERKATQAALPLLDVSEQAFGPVKAPGEADEGSGQIRQERR